MKQYIYIHFCYHVGKNVDISVALSDLLGRYTDKEQSSETLYSLHEVMSSLILLSQVSLTKKSTSRMFYSTTLLLGESEPWGLQTGELVLGYSSQLAPKDSQVGLPRCLCLQIIHWAGPLFLSVNPATEGCEAVDSRVHVGYPQKRPAVAQPDSLLSSHPFLILRPRMDTGIS
jgi:hypothetical protein